MKALRIGFMLLALCVFMNAMASAESVMQFKVTDIRHHADAGSCKVEIHLNGIPEYKVRSLEDPDRVFIDITGAGLDALAGKYININDGVLSRIRTSQFTANTARVVLDLSAKAEYTVKAEKDPSRLVVELKAQKAPAPPAAVTPAPAAPTLKPSAVKPPAAPQLHVNSIVIDPGHGGHDPGAIGPGNLMEKDVVLEIAKELKRQLEATGQYKILMTRDTDVFLTLEERTAYANRVGADLFVSVHVNADKARRGKGFETYLLNWTDDVESMKVAARENKISLSRMKQARNEVDSILASLAMQYKRDESLMLAHKVQESMVGNVVRNYDQVMNLGVKQAFFYVLYGARMPSILVEASFISHSVESKRLASQQYRADIAQGIAKGIGSFFAESSKSSQTFARR